MRRRLPGGDGGAVVALLLLLGVVTALTWRRWGNPELDPGADLTVADLVAHGAAPYRDVRYFYGPAGIYSLALAFKVLGTSFTVAFAFGYAQTIAILVAFYALARRWLEPLGAGLATAIVLAIGFSGSLFDFVLPHTNAATFGLLFVLLELLALARGRPLLAGLAAGVVGLTRPEFAAVAAAVAAGWALGRAREDGWRAGLSSLVPIALPAVVVSGAVLGALAAVAGWHRLVYENLVPVDFVRVAGFRFQEDWAPFTIESILGTAGRGLVYLGLLAGATGAWEGLRAGRGAARLLRAWPLPAAVVALLALDGALRATGILPGTRHNVEQDCTRLLIGMSWLPVAAVAAAAVAARALWRGDEPPLARSWGADTALIAGALALALRSYNDFTTDVYSTYYAAPLVLVAAIGHQHLARRRPAAAPVAYAALGVVALTLLVHSYFGLYRDNNTPVHTARGTYVASDVAAPAIQRTVDFVRSHTRAGEPILVLPDDPGIHFMTARPPALYEVTFLPGTLDSVADERAAIARLQRERTRVVVLGARRFDQYGLPEIGVDFNRLLMAFVRRTFRPVASFGDVAHPPRNSAPSRAFTVFLRR